MAFRDQVCAHLSRYRKSALGIAEEGVFLHRGQTHRKGHVLPRGRERQNLLAPYGEHFFESEHRSIKLHQYFHHLNSSQALCINLFYPLLKEERLQLLVRALGSDMNLPVTATFESDSKLEKAARRTSFDFHLQNAEARNLFVEVKYTEEGFGDAKNDEEHLAKFRDTYAPLLKDSKYLVKQCDNASFFLKHYQVLRNLVHIAETSEVVFLFPRANKKVVEQAAHARVTLLSEYGRERMRILFLEDLVAGLIASCKGTSLEAYYESFRHKYLDYAQ